MSRQVFKLPDLGEGTVSAEIVAWHVKPGDLLKEDQPMVEMSTDKAVVEIPAPFTGRILTITGKPGDVIAVGAELATFDTDATGEFPAVTAATAPQKPAAPPTAAAAAPSSSMSAIAPAPGAAERERGPVRASPATRRRAQEAGIDLASVAGTGVGGRVMPEDLSPARPAQPGGAPATTAEVAAGSPAAPGAARKPGSASAASLRSA
jgi:pyruvate/2-oxoglutarate dehydrogenase complex dihydrolipoamide acyltransferase (E2) component